MRLKGKLLRLILCSALVIVAAGCSGINVQKSVSPLDFILPGLLKVQPRPPSEQIPALATNRVEVLVAQAN